MPWTVPGQIEFGPVATLLAITLLAASVTVKPWVGRREYARLLAAAAHDPAALLRFHRRSAASSAVLLAAEAAVLATAVSLPWAAVGLGPVDTAAAVRNFLTLGEATAALPPPLGELGHGLAVAAVLAAALVAAFTVLNTVSDLRTQRRAGQPLLLLVQAAQPDHPDLGALRALTPAPGSSAGGRRCPRPPGTSRWSCGSTPSCPPCSSATSDSPRCPPGRCWSACSS